MCCILAGIDNDILDHGYRYLCAVLIVWCFHWSDAASVDLFPLAHRYPAFLLYSDTGTEGTLYPCIQTLVVKQDAEHLFSSGEWSADKNCCYEIKDNAFLHELYDAWFGFYADFPLYRQLLRYFPHDFGKLSDCQLPFGRTDRIF